MLRPFGHIASLRCAPAVSRRTVLKGAGAILAASTLPALGAEPVLFADLVARGEEFSAVAKKLAGVEVEMRGYMAPPLKPEVNFFVLTELPTAVCPFCDSTAAWPDDIVVVFLRRRTRALDYDQLIKVQGTLEVGPHTDEATGFVSLVRLRDAQYKRV
jgi:hypothetical protein